MRRELSNHRTDRGFTGGVLILVLLAAGAAEAATDAGARCSAARLKALGKHAACHLKAVAKATARAAAPDVSRCNQRLVQKWTKIDTKGNGSCPVLADAAKPQAAVDQLVIDLSSLVHLPAVPKVCSALPVTGLDVSRVSRDDGDLQLGAPFDYVDNEDGTITDLVTGLMWEKKVGYDGEPDPLNPHDADNCYSWMPVCAVSGTACTDDADCPPAEGCVVRDCQTAEPWKDGLTIFDWVAALNAEGFAGYDDWRVPNVREMMTLVAYPWSGGQQHNRALEGASCGSWCLDIQLPECGCAQDENWTSTMHLSGPFLVGRAAYSFPVFVNGVVTLETVRAVRGGL